MPRASRDDRVVIRNIGTVAELYHVARRIKPDDFAENNLDICCAVKNASYGLGDLAGAEHGRRYLIKKRLKNMVIFAVDKSDVDRLISESKRRPQAAEAAADYHNFCFLCCHNLLLLRIRNSRSQSWPILSITHSRPWFPNLCC